MLMVHSPCVLTPGREKRGFAYKSRAPPPIWTCSTFGPPTNGCLQGSLHMPWACFVCLRYPLHLLNCMFVVESALGYACRCCPPARVTTHFTREL